MSRRRRRVKGKLYLPLAIAKPDYILFESRSPPSLAICELERNPGARSKYETSSLQYFSWQRVSGSTSRELKDALDIQGGGLEQHWVIESRVSWGPT